MLLEYFLSTWPLLAVRQDSALPDQVHKPDVNFEIHLYFSQMQKY